MQKKIMSLIPLVICLSPGVNAKNLSMDFLVGIGESDNARKAQDNELSEKQNRYTASLQGDWDKEWVDAKIQYMAFRESFAEDSQSGENYLQGDSSLKFGNPNNMLNLELNHSRRTLLKDVDEAPTSDNQEDREIFSVMPSMRFDISRQDELVVYADASRTRYLESELRDSDRNTYGVDHLHNFSATDKINLRLERADSDFIYFPQSDYTLNSAVLVYSVSLRKLTYSLGAGQDQSEPEFGDKHSSPHYEASLGYTTGANQIRLSVDKTVTDTSFGQGIGFVISDLPGVDAATNQVELIERRTSGLNWTTGMLCARCNVILGVTQTKDVYIDSPAESTRQGISASLTYNLSERASLLLSHNSVDQESAVSLLTGGDYQQDFSRVSFRYEFLRSFSVDVFAEKEKRSSDEAVRDYTENFIGLALGYHFE